ncbi:MAG: ImmA/IrrE family metallo-endopeptidase [Actinomyces succiniciruminis]|nr:ImmA/IrrE family metallo-endopeptidase [Actinomyces succiniciruminis]
MLRLRTRPSRNALPRQDEDVETQANAFAAEFLMPEHVIRPQLRALTPAPSVHRSARTSISDSRVAGGASRSPAATRCRQDAPLGSESREGPCRRRAH